MVKRFIDRKDRDKIVGQSSEFIARYYGSFVIWGSYAVILIVFAILLHIEQALYKPSLNGDSIPTEDVLYGAMILMMVFLMMAGYLHIMIGRMRKAMNAVEFQNMFFSSAMRMHTKFSFILNKVGTVVYTNTESAQLFGLNGDEKLNIESILKSNGIKEQDKELINKALEERINEEIAITLTNSAGKKSDAMFIITPMDKPDGYYYIRGY